MVRPLPPEIRRRIFETWLEGYNYRQISSQIGVSLGAITAIIEEERKKMSDIDELRELKLALKQANTTIPDALRGAGLIEKLNSLNIPPERLLSCITILDQYGERAVDALAHALRLQELETSLGKTYEQVVTELGEKARELQETTQRIGTLRKEEQSLTNSLRDLQRLKALWNKMSQHSLTISKLEEFMNRSLKLDELGFTPQAAEILASELAKRGLDPQKASTTLADIFLEYSSSYEAVAKLRGEKRRLEKEVEIGRDQLGGMVNQLEALKEQTSAHSHLVQKEEQLYGVKIKQLEDEYSLKRREIQALHGKSMKDLRQRYKEEKERLESEISKVEQTKREVQREVQNLEETRDVILKNLSEAEKILAEQEAKIKSRRPLATLATLASNPESAGEPEVALEPLLPLFAGLRNYVEANESRLRSPRTLRTHVDNLVDELSREVRVGTSHA